MGKAATRLGGVYTLKQGMEGTKNPESSIPSEESEDPKALTLQNIYCLWVSLHGTRMSGTQVEKSHTSKRRVA